MGIETVAIVALAAGTALSAGAAVKSGYDQNQLMKYQARQQDADAGAERSAASLRADQIRKAAERQRSKATGAIAASGVRIGEGSAGDAEAYITRTGEYDALSEIIEGAYRGDRLRADADISRQIGRNAQTSGWLNAGGTVLGNYGMAYARGFNMSKSATRAPVYTTTRY